MQGLFTKISNTDVISNLVEQCGINESRVTIGGLTGSLGSIVAASLLSNLSSPVLVVMPSPAQSEAMLNDLTSITGSEKIGYMPPAHRHPYDSKPLAIGPRNERVDAMLRFSSRSSSIMVTQPEVLIEHSPDQDWIKTHTIRLAAGDSSPREILLLELTSAGYKRESLVDAQGQFAVRGGLIDLFPFGHENPVRIEYDEDEIYSLRRFDPTTQRSIQQIGQITILVGEEPKNTSSGILDLLPDNAIIFWHGWEAIEDRIRRFLERAAIAYKNGVARGNINPEQLYRSFNDIKARAERFRQVISSEFMRGRRIDIDFSARQPDPFQSNTAVRSPKLTATTELHEYVKQYIDRDYKVWMTTDTSGEKDRLNDLFLDYNLEQVRIITPTLSEGFVCESAGIAVLTAHELFNRRRLRARHTRFRRRAVQFDRLALHRGDLVVHAEYGIGRYEGLQMVKVQENPHECLRIRYADDIILYIRIEHFSLVEKYTGMENARPKLSRIGTKDWERAKKKTRKALQDMADELIQLYAKRKVVQGHTFPEDTHWQREMETSFEFEDTPDQVISNEEIKKDLQTPHPMDRLLCGDVGFGKTEIAIRAAFKVVQESHQVAVLVPTTILAQQHYETFRERLTHYPIRIEALSRFRTTSEQRKIVKDLNDGLVDIVIGTHRLLSRDVGFKRLGLLVIDEEHRFGVRHKERLKQMKTNVDVLTMTATPIPRTMHMALMGARDTSQINTPPVDRLPIQTEIYPWSEDLIRDAILREVDRQGQVFFLHNRVQSIHAVQSMLERLAPGIKYGIAHGQMKERELEKVMFDFMHGRYDVLVTTMIIESGLDIPNANTLIVNRADRFGLAQLYQLRGRIGRSNRQAYAYLLTPPKLAMTADARRRLATLNELTDLGSGFKIAMRDLEIRGAGNLLGAQQSGFINAVGFDLYTQMLEDVVQKAKGEEKDSFAEEEKEEVRVDFDGPALIPPDYIDDSDLRFDFYRRLSTAGNMKWIDRLEEELIDRFGKLPVPARNLLGLARLKVMSGIAGFSRIAIRKTMFRAVLDLPSEPEQSQHLIGRLVAQADPEPVEFRLGNPVELIHRINSGNSLQQASKFLHHLTREGILQR